MAEKRDVVVKLNLTLGPDSERAIKRLEEATRKTSEAQGVLRNLALGGVAGRIGTFQGYGQAAADLGFTGTGAAISRAAGPLGLAAAAGGATMAGIRKFSDPFSTASQDWRSLAQNVIPGGSTVLGIADTFSGRAARMEQEKFKAEQESVEVQRRQAMAQHRLSFDPAQAGRESLAASYTRGRAVLPGTFDRSTAEGERQFREESRLYPLKVQGAKLEKEAAAAAREHVVAKEQLNKISARGRDLETEKVRLMKELGGESSGPERERVLQAIKNTQQEIEGVANLQRSAGEAVSATGSRSAQVRAEQARARAATFGARAEIAESRAAAYEGGNRKLGMMNVIEQGEALASLQAVKQFGPQGVPPEVLAKANMIAGETVGKMAAQAGAASPFAAEFRALAPTEFGDVEAARKEAAEGRKKEAEELFAADKALAQTAAAQGRELAAVITDTMKIMFDKMKADILNNILIGRNPA